MGHYDLIEFEWSLIEQLVPIGPTCPSIVFKGVFLGKDARLTQIVTAMCEGLGNAASFPADAARGAYCVDDVSVGHEFSFRLEFR
jgi:hypothetical protein